MGNLNQLKEVTREELKQVKLDGPIGIKADYGFNKLLDDFKQLDKKAKSYSEYLQNEIENGVKDASECENRKKQVDKVKNDIRNTIKGMTGENKIKSYLSRLDLKMIVLHNLCFFNKEGGQDGHSAQIDFIVITEGEIFILESKNWSNIITLKDIDSFFLTTDEQGKIQPSSPYEQVQGQMVVLESILRNNCTLRALFGCKSKTWFYPMVVIANTDSVLEKDGCNSSEVKDRVIRVDNLRGKINEVNGKIAKWDTQTMITIANEILVASWNPEQKINGEEIKNYKNTYEKCKKRLIELGLHTSGLCKCGNIMLLKYSSEKNDWFWGCAYYQKIDANRHSNTVSLTKDEKECLSNVSYHRQDAPDGESGGVNRGRGGFEIKS